MRTQLYPHLRKRYISQLRQTLLEEGIDIPRAVLKENLKAMTSNTLRIISGMSYRGIINTAETYLYIIKKNPDWDGSETIGFEEILCWHRRKYE